MKRLQKLLPSELNQRQRKLYNNITSGRRSYSENEFRLSDKEGRLEGPFNLFVIYPDLGSILNKLGEFTISPIMSSLSLIFSLQMH